VTTTREGGRRPRVRAPELRGRGWLNTDGPLALADLRGRFTVLDFWTFCCINCLHVLDELREVEEKYDGELVVVGVHSPKFEHEADPAALAAAVERYDVRHPVLDDPELVTWQAYTARAWPTLVLVDPEGYVVAQYAGEGHEHAIDALVAELREEHLANGNLQPGDSPYVPPTPEPRELRFPAKAIRLPGKGFLVADAGHHQVVELAEDAETVVRRIGSGDRGRADGPAGEASFNEPNGLVALPPEVAREAGYDVVVADTVNHLLRGVETSTGEVRTVAGDGEQWMQGDGTTSLSSPWDVAWWQDRVWVAMAGIHQLWTFDPRTGEVKEWPSPSGPDTHPYAIEVVDDIIWYNESRRRPDALVRFDPKTEKFQSWAIPSGVGIIRHMTVSPEGNLVFHQSSINRVGLVIIEKPGTGN